MQHVWRYLAKPKGEPGMEPPADIDRFFVTQSSRKEKVGTQVSKALEKEFGYKPEDIEGLYLAKLR